jgi:hypothetical protein
MSPDTWLLILANAIPVGLIAPVFLLLWLDRRDRSKIKAAEHSTA